MKIIMILLTGLTLSISAFSQSAIKGKIQDSTARTGLSGATIQVRNTSFSKSTVSALSGEFSIAEIPNGSYKLTVTFVGFDNYEKTITVQGKDIDLGNIELGKSGKTLTEVVIKATTPPTQQKGDTVQFNANQFKVNPDANVEDLVKKMPGIQIENGEVKAQGETVRKVTIDGREFFGDDATAALRNLPAEVVDKIQVFDRLSDQAQLTGVDDGNSVKAINVVTREDRRNGQFGRVYAGYGTDDRYQAGGAVNFFNKNRRISVVGLFNNINQQNFSSSDMLGLSGGNSGRGGGMGRGGSGNFQTGQQNGITKTNALGLNYSDLWGKKLETSGSYFFNNNTNDRSQRTNREQFNTNVPNSFYSENAESINTSTSHRFNMRMQYKIDSQKSLIISPSLSYQENDIRSYTSGEQTNLDGTVTSRTVDPNRVKGNGYNFNNYIFYRQALGKTRRSFGIGLTTGFSNRNSTREQQTISTFFKALTPEYDSTFQQSLSETRSQNYSANLEYSEPIGKKGSLQFGYNPGFSKNEADTRAYQFDDNAGKYSILDTSLSNVFTNNVTTQRGGVNYRVGDRQRMFAIGVDLQNTELDNDQTYPAKGNLKKSFSNILPNAMFRGKIGEKSNLMMFYRASTSTPSVNQLQNVININNVLFPTTGNPNLDQSYSNTLSTRYTYSDSRKGNSFFFNLFATNTMDYVTNATFTATSDSVLTPTFTLKQGSRLSKPVNLDGYWNLRTFATYSFPFKSIKSNLTFNGGYNYVKTPGLINNILNETRNSTFSGGIILASNISEYVDFNINYNASRSIVKNDLQQNLNNKYFSQSAGVRLNLLSKSGWYIDNELNNMLYRGLTAEFNQDYWLWNAAIGKKFLKDQKGDLRLSVFDLLKQNRSISRTVSSDGIEDNWTQVLQQYFMLTFSYRLRNFGKAPAPAERRMQRPMNPMTPGGPIAPGGQRGDGGPGGGPSMPIAYGDSTME
ncbi:outer membrane beta-barrel protein [Flavihumibacter sediminis]|nr:outer membrane beta-barrel protein [Flavihumibacter sediminis]